MKIDYKPKKQSERRQTALITETPLAFGSLRTDHMFVADYVDGAWQNARLVPYQNLAVPPGAVALHYAQSIFEGAKAFRHANGELYTFRLDKNANRLNRSAELMCMASIPEDLFIEGTHALLDLDRLWYPEGAGASLYIRPLMFGTEDMVGVKPSKTFTFCVFLSPCGPYYPTGFDRPVTLLITERFHRAAPGGTGSAKASGNYGASIRAGVAAAKIGASQVLYLDVTNRYIEEAGTMNHYHITKAGELVVPEFTDSILRSITAESMLEVCGRAGLKGRQERIELQSFLDGVRSGDIIEAGGFGTAAVIAPVGSYLFDSGPSLKVNDGQIGRFSKALFELLTGMQYGSIDAPEGWLKRVEHRDG